MNPNQRDENFYVAFDEGLREDFDRLFRTYPENVIKLSPKAPMEHRMDVEWMNKHVKDIEYKYAVETGKTWERHHLHLFISVVHDTKVHLNLSYLDRWFKEGLEHFTGVLLKGIHTDVRASGGSMSMMLRYVSKDERIRGKMKDHFEYAPSRRV